MTKLSKYAMIDILIEEEIIKDSDEAKHYNYNDTLFLYKKYKKGEN